MSTPRSASYQSNSDSHSDASDLSDVSNFAASPRSHYVSAGCSTKPATATSFPSPIASRSLRGSPKEAWQSPRGAAASPTSKQSPGASSPQPKFSPKGAVPRSPKELFASRSSLAVSSPTIDFHCSPKPQLAPEPSDVDKDSEQHSLASSAAHLVDYLNDPLMTLRTNREHSDLVIRERDDEPHLRFMSLYFTPATPQAVQAFRSNWSEETDALLQDDVFSSNKRAVFFCVFSDKQSLHSQSVKAHILRPSEAQTAACDPDATTPQLISCADTANSAPLDNVTPTATPLSLSSSAPLNSAHAVTLESGAVSRCHAVIHNSDTGASALCTMRVGINASAVEHLTDLPVVSPPASSARHARAGQLRKGKSPSASSPPAEELPSQPTELRSHSSVTLSSLGKDKTKCCIVPNMQKYDSGHLNAANEPEAIVPALGNVGECDLEEFEEFYSKEWEGLCPVDREIRFQQLQLLKIAKQNTVYRNFVADALQAEIVAKSATQRYPLADQKNIETALVVSSRSRQLQITMEAGLQPRCVGISLPGDPESEGDDAVCCVCFCGESLDDNQIVFCEGCNMAVHQSCYGIRNIPDGDWFCDSCVLSCRPTCVICHKKDGAFKVCLGARNSGASQSDIGAPPQGSRESKQWVHVLCALWHPEVSFESLAIMREADVSHAEFFSKKTCVFCNQNGYLLSCPGKCRQQYHPMCAWLGGWFIEHSVTPKPHSLSRKRDTERTLQAVSQLALTDNSKYIPPMIVAAKCPQCLDISRRKVFDQDYNRKMRKLLSQVPSSSGSKTSKRGSAAVLEDDSGRRMLHLVRRTFLPPDEFPLGACMICHFDVHNENRRKLRRSRLLVCSRGCGASVHEGCANIIPDDGSMEEDGSWTCMLCMEQESLGSVECMLCPRRGGLFQRCSEYPGWLHCVCARLLCNIRPGFKGFSISEPVNTGTMIQDYRDAKSKKVCCVCRQAGKVLHCCAHPGCEKYLHPICAMIKQCKSSFDNSKNGKNHCTLFCAQHSPVVDFAAADALALEEDAKNYARLLDLRLHLDKMRDLVNFSKRRERWKHHLDSVEVEILDRYEQRIQDGDASLCSAAILAPPISECEPALDVAIAECESGVANDDFLPRKREKGHAIRFDVPTRGGIGMIHVAKRKCPEIMFRYLNHLSKEEGRKGWLFPSKGDDKLTSPAKPLQHPSRSGKSYKFVSHLFPPSPAAGLHAGASPRVSRLGSELLHIPSSFSDLPASPSDPSNDRLTRSSQRGLSFGAFVRQRRDSDASDSDPIDPGPVILHPSGTKIDVFAGKFKGRMGEIIGYSAVGWYTASIKGIRETCKVRSNQFRAA